MNVETIQIEGIKEIYSAWRRGFIGGDYAMYEIGRILSREYVASDNIQIRNSDGELIETVKGVISLDKR